MDIKIGEVIASLRREKGITQEQFANELGVSIPAVSKWETGQTYPDITLLPVIAKFFAVSIDALMDFSIKDINNDLTDIMKQLIEYKRTGDYESGLKVATEAIKKYPNELELIVHMADFLMFNGSSDSSSGERYIHDSISYFETAIKLCRDTKRAVYFKRSIASLHRQLGQYSEALKILKELQMNEKLAVDIADLKLMLGDVKGAKKMVQENLDSGMTTFVQLCRILKWCYKGEKNYVMYLETQKFICNVLELLTWERPNYYDNMTSEAYDYLAEFYLDNKQFDEMWRALEKSAYHAARFDKKPSYDISDVKFMDELKDITFANCSSDNKSKYLLRELKDKFSQFSEDERYTKLINELEKTAATKKEIGLWK